MKIKSKYLGSILLSWLLFACSTSPKGTQDSNVAEPKSGLETLAILGTNDIHGTLAPLSLKSKESNPSDAIPYQAGGAANIAAYTNILKSEFGEHFIWLDGGDQFQGSIESNIPQGAPMVQFFNQGGLTAAAIGNHEFDFGILALKERMKEAKYPYLAANIQDSQTLQPASFPNTQKHILIKAGHLNVGVIGLSTLETPTTTRAINVKDLQFTNLKDATLREARALRKMGAQIVVLTAHVGLKCEAGKANPAYSMRKETDPQGDCGDQDEMVRLLRNLPAGTLDAVISGHSHQVVHHWVAGVPVIQGGAFGRYLNVIYLTYDWEQKKLIPEESRIEGPIPVCTQVFQNQNDCNGNRPAPKNGRGPLVAPRFHGKTISPDVKMASLIEPALRKSEKIKNKVLGYAVQPINHPENRESELGNLIADSIRAAVHTDFALMNHGGMRAPFQVGPITYESAFRTLPFDNEIAILKVTGKELKTILLVAESGARGFGSFSGLKLKLIDPKIDLTPVDLNQDGKFDPWEVDRILSLTLPNGDPIQMDRIYTLGLSDFLVTGGDDLGWAMSQIPPERIQMNTGILARDALVQYIEFQKELNTPQRPLIDPNHPRLVIEKHRPVKKSVRKAPHPHSKKRRQKQTRNQAAHQ
jgi:5'-nucleotidase